MYDDTKKPTPAQTRIKWARGLSNIQICDFLQGKLLESRATRGTEVPLLNELVHEIKHRLSKINYNNRRNDDEYYDDDGPEDEED